MRVQARVRMRVSGAAGPRQRTGRGQCMGQKLPLVYLALGSRPCKVLGRPPCSWPAESPPCRCGLSWTAGTRTPGPWGRGSFLRTRKTSRCSQLLRCPIWGGGGWWSQERALGTFIRATEIEQTNPGTSGGLCICTHVHPRLHAHAPAHTEQSR